ncbi:type IV pilin protein [Celerinatantimonas sp. MCCC 1A17872]|uniref:type IV pilin protein n=1 Tax=Celerinatantimonas sp. MCCC 1A17872 TaxID=3177514 RepID=UPI0038C547A7
MDESVKSSGWTLIELLIAMAISVLLMLMALPSYCSWLGEYHRQQAIVQLYALRETMEQYYLDNDQWPANLAALSFTSGSVEGYQFALTSNDEDSPPSLSATPSSAQMHDDPQVEQITMDVNGTCEVTMVDGSVAVCQGALS